MRHAFWFIPAAIYTFILLILEEGGKQLVIVYSVETLIFASIGVLWILKKVRK